MGQGRATFTFRVRVPAKDGENVSIQEQKRSPMTLARLAAVANSPTGFETITPQGARQLLEEAAAQALEDNHRGFEAGKLARETATLERVRALLTPWRSQVWTVDLEAALAGQPEAPKGQEMPLRQWDRTVARLERDLAAANARADLSDANRVAAVTAAYAETKQWMASFGEANARADAAEGRYRQLEGVNRANRASYEVELADRRAENARLKAEADGFEERISKLSAYNDQISAAEAKAALERDLANDRADAAERKNESQSTLLTSYAEQIGELEAERDQLAARGKEMQRAHELTHMEWRAAKERREADCNEWDDAHASMRHERDQLAVRVKELEAAVRSSDAGRDAAFDLIVEAHNERDAAHDALETINANRRTSEEAHRLNDWLHKAESRCTPAERAVLKACEDMQLGEEDADDEPGEPVEVGEDCYIYTDDQEAIARAELANRAAKAKRIP
jgi:uncharacterized coiled-coil DUF342 family protein